MKRKAFIIVISYLTLNCSDPISNSVGSIPEILQPDWKGIAIEKLPVKFGQVLKLNSNSLTLHAIVLDFNEDEKGPWVGLCFIHNDNLFGRQIPSGLDKSACLDLLDLTYIQIEALKNFEIIETIVLNKEMIGIGSISAAKNFVEMENSFKNGIEARKKNQTPCNKGLTDPEAVRECYFALNRIKTSR